MDFLAKMKKSSEKIWWNQIFVVPLHSQFRNEAKS